MPKNEFNPDYSDDPVVLHGVIAEFGKAIGNLQAENKKLREALESLTTIGNSFGGIIRAETIASEAIERKGE